jgi:hypothetical protein
MHRELNQVGLYPDKGALIQTENAKPVCMHWRPHKSSHQTGINTLAIQCKPIHTTGGVILAHISTVADKKSIKTPKPFRE